MNKNIKKIMSGLLLLACFSLTLADPWAPPPPPYYPPVGNGQHLTSDAYGYSRVLPRPP